MYKLRDYQEEAVNSIFTYFQTNNGNPLLALPTGTGKSLVIASFLENVYKLYPQQKILILTHVKELIAQNYSKLMSLWSTAPAGIYSAGLNKREIHQQIIFAGIGSVAKRATEFGHVDLIIVDEAHLISPNDDTMYQKFFQQLRRKNPYLKVIGLTATPWRLGHGKLTDSKVQKDGTETPPLFTDICFDVTTVNAFNRFIAEGYMAPLIPKSTTTKLDVDGVHMRGGEFLQNELQHAVDKYDITVNAVKEAIELGWNRKHWLVFCAGVEHAIHTQEILEEHGISCGTVHSKMSGAERDEAIEKFKRGEYQAMTNNNVLTTGFDFPEIDMILCLRPTASAVLWVQMLGRGTRPAEGKENCLVLDFAANTHRLGPINDPVTPKKKGLKSGMAPVKVCPDCKTYVHASVRVCDAIKDDGTMCGHQFQFETKIQSSASTEQLIKGDFPQVEEYKVDHITYDVHKKAGRPDMMKVSYYCDYQKFDEYICIEHEGFAGKKARDWWRERAKIFPVPATTEDAVQQAHLLDQPTHIRVWVNKKFPEILKMCFDGSCFGKQPATSELPRVEVRPRALPVPPPDEDEDIPF